MDIIVELKDGHLFLDENISNFNRNDALIGYKTSDKLNKVIFLADILSYDIGGAEDRFEWLADEKKWYQQALTRLEQYKPKENPLMLQTAELYTAPAPPELMFFYGTLRREQSNHHVLKQLKCQFKQEDSIKGDVFPTSYGFPCLMEGSGLVKGEIFEADANAVKYLDWFEGAPALYERRKTVTVGGTPVWVYYGTGAQEAIEGRE